MFKFKWNFPRHIFAREFKAKLRSSSTASSNFGDYEIPAREYAEYTKSGIFTLGPNFRLRSFTLRAHIVGPTVSKLKRIPYLSTIEPAK